MELYCYRAVVTSVADGDSITANIDLGLGIWAKGQKLRLAGINTPELRGEFKDSAIAAKAFLSEQVLGKEVLLSTVRDKKEKYGRYLVHVYLPGQPTSINQLLLDLGYAAEFM